MENISEKKALDNEIAFLSKKILELNKRLIESENTKSRFLSLVTNELNDPMTVLLGMIPHLKIQAEDKNEKIFSIINKEVLDLEFKIKNLVMAAEIESGNINISYSMLDPQEILDEVIKSLKYTIEEKNLEIKITNTIKEKIISDSQKIYIIMKNLISNACIYGIEKGVIDIGLSEKDSIFKITVKNQGEGPQTRYKPEVFTRFTNTTDHEHGLGIGLSIVRELCERFGGSIDYTAEDGHVIFSITLLLDNCTIDSQAYGSNEFLFDSFENAIEL
ncbi:MAG: hypothetical protein A2513_07695 [Sulfurimonas sp. RIFOXYD12_FULL_33_39]|uniref:sensor histidine kinase n=1 Tax=unclassified Sulfurimonas TaxID=2623549 RepID=UPI0008CCFC42|nr:MULTISPECIES: HAMP domain-containing sensor histidine kinase [unclassified Sulfurimonas]OHE09977.1 MAG: hypothetical protein A2513_07695 [Sulfurimonas sp. RIFOXYD12_FULL_33_39]OHE14803.1 MAG: hypothetical protein A2530_02785 [Sulfurimonas sp. RIFOXYD2_FULL_34_21]